MFTAQEAKEAVKFFEEQKEIKINIKVNQRIKEIEKGIREQAEHGLTRFEATANKAKFFEMQEIEERVTKILENNGYEIHHSNAHYLIIWE